MHFSGYWNTTIQTNILFKMSELNCHDAIDDKAAFPISNSIKCAYCGCQKDGVLVFYCDKCSRWVHASKFLTVLIVSRPGGEVPVRYCCL